MKDKELEKLEKYQLLKDRIAKVWRMRKVTVVPVVTGALGAVSVNFKVTRPSFFWGGGIRKSAKRVHCTRAEQECCIMTE